MHRNRYMYQRLDVRTEQSIQLVLKESRTPQAPKCVLYIRTTFQIMCQVKGTKRVNFHWRYLTDTTSAR